MDQKKRGDNTPKKKHKTPQKPQPKLNFSYGDAVSYLLDMKRKTSEYGILV